MGSKHNTHLSVKLTPQQLAALAAEAELHGVTVSQYVRQRLFSQQSATDSVAKLSDRLAAIEHSLAELASLLREVVRVPSFREYRSRRLAEGNFPDGVDANTAMLLVAQDYYELFGVWPTQNDKERFGPYPSGFDPTRWPEKPPAGGRKVG